MLPKIEEAKLKAKIRERNREYYLENREEIIRKNAQYQKENRTRMSELQKERRERKRNP